MGREVWMRKSDSCEANHSHVGVDVLQNALCKEDQPHRNTNQQYATWAFCGSEEELKDYAHQRVPSIQPALRPKAMDCRLLRSAGWSAAERVRVSRSGSPGSACRLWPRRR